METLSFLFVLKKPVKYLNIFAVDGKMNLVERLLLFTPAAKLNWIKPETLITKMTLIFFLLDELWPDQSFKDEICCLFSHFENNLSLNRLWNQSDHRIVLASFIVFFTAAVSKPQNTAIQFKVPLTFLWHLIRPSPWQDCHHANSGEYAGPDKKMFSSC